MSDFDAIFCFVFTQTGSGKTFTITGGAERYVDRGIIPRTLSYIFEYFQQVSHVFFQKEKSVKLPITAVLKKLQVVLFDRV